MQIRDRVKELRRVSASDLRPNPKNWRTHPETQQNALKGVLAEVGFADALLARELPDGSLMLIDGHLRAETTPDSVVPVLVLDVTEAEADKLLATLDPLAALAQQDNEKLAALLEGMSADSPALEAMLADLRPPASLSLGEPPPTVQENLEHILDIRAQRNKGRDGVVSKTDTEKYLVLVFETREAKGKLLAELNLPSDERYVAANALSIRAKGKIKAFESADRELKEAAVSKSGATG